MRAETRPLLLSDFSQHLIQYQQISVKLLKSNFILKTHLAVLEFSYSDGKAGNANETRAFSQIFVAKSAKKIVFHL
jgi:hypothetical protein